VLASAAFAAVVALGLAPLAQSPSTGAADPVVARLASPSPGGGPTPSALTLLGAVAGVTSDHPARPTLAPPVPTDPSQLTGYRWPLLHGRITLPFGPWHDGSRIVDGQPFHDGLDLATLCGDRIVAAHDGLVLAAGRHYDSQMGWIGDLRPYFERLDSKSLWTTLPIVVVVDDGNGYRSLYAHFGKIVVKRGQTIRAGQLLGYEGQTGHATGCHLHYGLFSPRETAVFGIDPTVAEHMQLPHLEIARIDPQLVLPPRTEPAALPSPAVAPQPRHGDDGSY
jgi:murein DD-endopeptidase MepM/ murein hydrolase activator NlpD